MKALINVGLLRNSEGFVRLSDINVALDTFAVEDLRHRVAVASHESMEEDTYIAQVDGWDEGKAFEIAQALEQDAIAFYDLDECKGYMVGPHADVWGEFDSRLFKLL